MKFTPHIIGKIGFYSLAILALLVFAPTARGQRPSAPPGPIRPAEEMRPASLEERRFRMMEIEREAAQPRTEEQQKLALTQIAEDYREIQVINNRMLSASIPSATPNFLMIARTLGDIRKRATRLKDNLRLAKLKEKKPAIEKYKPAQTTPELKAQLLALDESIMRLIKNPVFKNPEVINVEAAAKAQGDLDHIIATSELISKDAERLKKSAP